MIEGSGSESRAGSGSGSIPLTSGSGSGSWRPKNTWIRIRIRIRNTAFKDSGDSDRALFGFSSPKPKNGLKLTTFLDYVLRIYWVIIEILIRWINNYFIQFNCRHNILCRALSEILPGLITFRRTIWLLEIPPGWYNICSWPTYVLYMWYLERSCRYAYMLVSVSVVGLLFSYCIRVLFMRSKVS